VAVEVGEAEREEDEDELSRLEEVVVRGFTEVASGRVVVVAGLGLTVVVVVSMI